MTFLLNLNSSMKQFLQYVSSLNSREIGGTHGVSVVHIVVVQVRIVGIPVPHVRVPIVPIVRRQGPHE